MPNAPDMLRVVFYPIFGSYVFVFLCAAVLCGIVLASRPQSEQFSRYGQRTLLILRFLALILLLFAMLRPTLIHTVSQQLSSVVNILLDQSQSMTRNDERGGMSRFTVAKDSLTQVAPQLRHLQRQVDVRAFSFDSTLHPLDIVDGVFPALPVNPVGQETPLGFTLDAIRERSAGKRVLANIILTDGAQRARPIRDILPQDAANRLRDAGMPLYAIPLGQAGLGENARDISVVSIHANDRVFEKNNFLVAGELRISGFAQQTIPVQLLFENEHGRQDIVTSIEVTGGADGQSIPYRLVYAPQSVGLFKYTVRVPPQEREISDRNNEQSSFVQVIEGGLNVLFIQGSPTFDYGPLRQSLNASPDINVQYVRVNKQGDLSQALQAAPTPYKVFIWGDVDSGMFTDAELKTVAEQVKDGSGLIMLGGLYAFGAGGYADTPFAEVSPVELRRADRQPLDQPIREDIHWSATQPIPMLLTESGKRHYVMKLVPDAVANEQRWTELPPLLGANRLRMNQGATPLLIGPHQQILLVARMASSGRVLAFAGDSTYRWRTRGYSEEHKTFWRQIVLWLAKMEDGGAGASWITLENNRLLPGDTAKFQVFLRNDAGEDVRDFPVTAKVVKAINNDTESVPLVMEDGVPTGSFRSTEFSGDYIIQTEAMLNGEAKEAEARFLVQDRNLELDNPVAYPRLLLDISEKTGGRSIPPEQLGDLLEELIQQSDELVEKIETATSLFDTWYLLLLFTLLLSVEWGLRKYWGLA